ncbi:hypothetical protein L208DRAFT_1386039 [Tricholoma matsutake]|nr:hypothetical protein L208DRAFT_1386039 [Tricholoma matsutake 945]
MIPCLLLLALPLAAAALDKTFGVHPDLITKYIPLASGNWQCLDGSKEIPWAFVNDDSCDCPDGSDEPGTSACSQSMFYCLNKGHIGSSIPSTRVNDGLCEPECCDGSDELPGVCQDVCKEIGEAYRKKRDEQRKIQRIGFKIRSTYIQFAHKEKKRLEAIVEQLAQEIEVNEKEVARLKDVADRTESLSQAALEHKQQSALYRSLLDHSNALKSLQHEHKQHLEREKALGEILNTLRSGYNPNYQDMAVLEAVRGWEELAGLPHINDVRKDGDFVDIKDDAQKSESEPKDEDGDGKEKQDDGMWSAEKLEKELGGLVGTDYLSLLLEYEEHIRSPRDDEGSILFDLMSYLPDSIIPQYEDIRDTLLVWLKMFGIVHGQDDSAAGELDSTRARQAFTDAQSALERLKTEKTEKEGEIGEIFDVHGFGREGEWKKLDGQCVQTDSGDYTYELCFFGEARQIPKHGGSTFSLGNFESWNPSADVKPNQPDYYKKQVYQHGTRCWNGPERSVVLLLTCGTENALLTVAELEKCEYQFTGTTPALCLPLDAEGRSRDEL